MSTTSMIYCPTFQGITNDMLTKILTGKRMAKIIHPLSVTLKRNESYNNTVMLQEVYHTLSFRYKSMIDPDIYYEDPSIDDMIKDQAVKALNSALYGDIREDINKVINGLFNNHDTYEAANALRKIVDKTMV